MLKEKSILIYFLGWLIIGILIMFVGVNNVFASTYVLNYEYLQQYYDNRGNTLTEVTTTWNDSLQSYVSNSITTVSNSYGAGLSISSPIPLIKNHTYTLSIYFVDRNNIALSSKSEIAVGTSLSDAKINYAKSDYYAETLYSKVNNSSVLQFTFKAGQNGGYIFIPWTTTSNVTQNYVLTEINIDDLGSEGISQDDINNSLNNQTTIIQDKINDMEQAIIDSNKETQDVIKDQFNDCYQSENLFPYENITISDVFKDFNLNTTLEVGKTYTLSWESVDLIPIDNYNGSAFALMPSLNNYSIINTLVVNSYTFTVTASSNGIRIYKGASYADSANFESLTLNKVMLNEGPTAKEFAPYGEEVCKNKLDETNDQLGNLNDSLNDSNIDGSLGNAGSFFDSFKTEDHGGLSGIITAPLVAINEMLNTSCEPLSTTFKGKELSLPCGYDFWSKMPEIQSFLNLVLGGMLCYNIVKKLFKLIERIKNPEDDRVEVMDL